MKVIFHPRFYEVYTSDPAAAPGRMEPMVKALEKEFEFIEPEPASERDLERVHGKSHIQYVKGDTRFMNWVSSPQEGPFWQGNGFWWTTSFRPHSPSWTPCQSPFLLGFLLLQ